MANMNNLQNLFLNKLRQERQTVTLITTNGYQAKGQIAGFDQHTVVLMGKDGQQLTYKHAISTIVPERAVDLTGWWKEVQ